MSSIFNHLKSVLSHQAFHSQNIDYAFKFIKATYSKLKSLPRDAATNALLEDLSGFLTRDVLTCLVKLCDEQYCKVLEYVLKIIYRINKVKKGFNDQQLREHLDEVIGKFSVNANLVGLYIKLVALMVDGNDAEDVKKLGRIVRKYAYADQKELVRVANVKSVARFLNGLEVTRCSPSLFDVYMALVLILHDEHPEIRSYLVQSPGIHKFVDPGAYSVKSPSLVSQDAPNKTKAMVVDLNEQMLLESILKTTLASARSNESEKETLILFVNDFLVQSFMTNRLYREHQLKNFDDKIFFYEPPNKYCDLLWLQWLAFGLLCEPGIKELVDQAQIKAALQAL